MYIKWQVYIRKITVLNMLSLNQRNIAYGREDKLTDNNLNKQVFSQILSFQSMSTLKVESS